MAANVAEASQAAGGDGGDVGGLNVEIDRHAVQLARKVRTYSLMLA